MSKLNILLEEQAKFHFLMSYLYSSHVHSRKHTLVSQWHLAALLIKIHQVQVHLEMYIYTPYVN